MSQISHSLDGVESRHQHHIAALDLGSNSFHLVVARVVAGHLRIVHKVKQRVRLADGLSSDNLLSEEAMQRGLHCLEAMAESIKGFSPESVRIVATYTLRKASNKGVFFKAARAILPYPIEVISGTEEARLIYHGVANTHHSTGRRLIIDIGGGSTEFVIGEQFEPKLLRSLQLGCVSYKKRYFSKGNISQKAFNKAITAACQELELIDERYQKLGWHSCIGTSGTIKAIVQLVDEINQGASNGIITQADLNQLMARAIKAGHVDELDFESLGEERRPVFASGLAILIAIFQSLNIEQMHFSPAALREGVLYEMEDELTHHDIRERTAQSLATRYDVDTAQAQRVLDSAMTIYKQVKSDWQLQHKELRNMLSWAALLHEVGLQINSRGVQKHSAYVLQNVDMPGFNQEQQLLLATLVRFHRKKIRPEEIAEFSQYQPLQVYKLVALLRLAVLLNIKRQDGILPDFNVRVGKHKIELNFPEGWLAQKPIFSADLEREQEQIKVLELGLRVD